MAEKKTVGSDVFMRDLALMMAVVCVRNTIIEEYHGRGSLSQEDMKAFNKEVSNKLYTFLRFLLKGTPGEREALLGMAGMFYPRDWNKPVLDRDLAQGIRLMSKDLAKFDHVSSNLKRPAGRLTCPP